MQNPLTDTPAGDLPPFAAIRPEHVEPALQATLAANRAELARILERAQQGTPSFERDILPLEELGDRLHRIWSPVSHLHAVANTPDLRQAYNRCLPHLSRYHTELGQNAGLFQLFEKASAALDPGRADGSRALMDQALRDFRLAGVALPEDRKRRFMQVMEELTELQAKFEQNLLDSMAAWSHRETDPARLDGIPQNVLARAAEAAVAAGGSGWEFRLDQPTYVAVLTHARDRGLRALFHRAWATRASDQPPSPPRFDNSGIMERVLGLRHEAATLVGFANFCEYSLATKMAASVAEVEAFLARLVAASRPAALAEFGELQSFAGLELAAWDVAFWSEELRRQKFSISDEELRPFFPLPTVLNGLFTLVERLYGIRLEAVDGVAVWHPSVRYFRVLNGNGDADRRAVHGLLRAGGEAQRRLDGRLRQPQAAERRIAAAGRPPGVQFRPAPGRDAEPAVARRGADAVP